jgi:hypothetical protein
METMETAVPFEPEYVDAIAETALFYPCCGADLNLPIRLFASTVSATSFCAHQKTPAS